MRPSSPQQRRVQLLGIAMLIVLAISVAVAWSLTATKGRPSRNGAEIIGTIRRDGLSAHWGKEVHQQWYLTTIKGRPARWGWSLRGANSTVRGFEGLSISFRGSLLQGAGIWEHWTLNNNADEGEYRAHGVTSARMIWATREQTNISLRNGRVVVNNPSRGSGQADAPTEYIPEGTMDLALWLAVRNGEPAEFSTVFNENTPAKGRVQFGVVDLELKKANNSAAGLQAIVTTMGASGGMQKIVVFDSQGQLIREVYGDDVVRRAVSKEEVLAAFPDAAAIVRQVLSESGLGVRMAAPEPTDGTGDAPEPTGDSPEPN